MKIGKEEGGRRKEGRDKEGGRWGGGRLRRRNEGEGKECKIRKGRG